MKDLITKHPDYQLKPVISNKEDLEEVKEKLTKEKAFNAIVEGMRILGWDK